MLGSGWRGWGSPGRRVTPAQAGGRPGREQDGEGLLQGAHLSSPLVEAGPAERLGPESGGLPLPQLGRKHVVGCGPCAWGRQVPTPRAPEGVVGSRPTSISSHQQESSWMKPRASCTDGVSR